MSLIGELRRRQVFRAAAWYAAAAWLAIQVASTVIPEFGRPQWLVRAVIVVSILGFPVALALAWAFDLSSVGLRREPSRPPPADGAMAAATSAPLWRIPSFWIALVLGAGLAVSAQQAWQRIVKPALGERPGIAVLPFANLSPDPENAFFADGLHEEILATLARTSSLRVISRTSVQQYRDTTRNLREIADALDVSLILEGSVRREGDDLRLTLQLIDGHTDEHLWAETYDSKFENALHLQRTVAQQIVASIGAQLTPAEDRLIVRAVPAIPDAYAFYLQALAHWNPIAAEPELRVAEGLLSRALEFDPRFGLGYALRAKVRVWIYATTASHLTTDLSEARGDIERALELDPDLPDALVARASYMTYVRRDPAGALPDLDRALELAPNDADAHNMAGLTKRRLGRFDEALVHFRETARLKPSEPAFDVRVTQTLEGLGRFDEAATHAQEVGRRFPAWYPYAELARFRMHFFATGETAGWAAAYERLAPQLRPVDKTAHAIPLHLAMGDLAGLARYLEVEGAAGFEDPLEYETLTALLYSALGETARAPPHLERIVDDMSTTGAATYDGGVALLLLGRPDEAVRVADEAVRALPESRDAVNGPTVAVHRAWVLIRSGSARVEEGYAELERLLGAYRVQPRAYSITPLAVMLREDPRAERIIREAIERQDVARKEPTSNSSD